MYTHGRAQLSAGKAMEIPLIATEQYPERLGPTAKELDIGHAVGVFPKTLFSMCTSEVKSKLDELYGGDGNKLEHIVLFGIEVCTAAMSRSSILMQATVICIYMY